ncbi:uncharacterized protein LOC110055245 isoform X2 [Orbicella faveolata]|uniref:uncharacterized protein LOC110055245 isoform X2 n=1 Tax=Orbicella faveolata TaxID=48498 RepID=UPI0009E466B3|nr:uncharacterized protein LOC110055245 isoform X2 [Orbicella faveolata]
MNMQDDAVIGDELDDVEIPVQYESSGVVQEDTNAGTKEVQQEENTAKDFEVSVVKTSFSTHDVEDAKTEGTEGEEDSPINRIHSEILELTKRISRPEAGILNLIRATEEAENEAKRQQEVAAAALSPSKESLLLWAMAGHGSGDFSIQGAFRGLSPLDLKQMSTSPYVSKTPAVIRKATLQSDEGGKASVGDKESLDTSPKKDKAITMNSEMGASGDVSVKPQTAEELPQTGKGTETRKSEMTDRDMLASQSVTLSTRQGLASQKTMMTNEQAMECLLLPSEVVPEDIISIKGQQVEIASKQSTAPVSSTGFPLQESNKQWIDVKQDREPVKTHNIHHFCTMPSRVELPPHLCKLTRDEHTRDKFFQVTGKQGPDVDFKSLEEVPEVNETEEGVIEDDKPTVKLAGKSEERRWSVVAQKILMEALVAGDSDETLNRLKKASDSLFSAEPGESLDIVGVKVELKEDTSRLYWTPAPPKMNMAPATIKSQL